MNRFAAVGALSLCLSALPQGPASAAEPIADGGWGTHTCLTSSHARITPGLTMQPVAWTFTEHGKVEGCDTHAGPVPTSYVVSGGHGEGSCMTASFDAPIDISWSDGTVTHAKATGNTVGTFVIARAEFLKGRLAGGSYTFLAAVATPDPTLCASTGVSDISVYGKMDISSEN